MKKPCSRCKEVKALSKFYHIKGKNPHYTPRCKLCHAADCLTRWRKKKGKQDGSMDFRQRQDSESQSVTQAVHLLAGGGV